MPLCVGPHDVPPSRRRTCVTLAVVVACSGLIATPVAAEATSGQPPREVTARASAQAEPDHVDQWWYDAMSLDEVHRETRGEGAVVAVLDGYLDTSVPDLQGADVEVRPGCRGATMAKPSGSMADHGTAMTTLIVGQGTGNAAGGRGVLGVAPEATVRFYTLETEPDGGPTTCYAPTAGELMVEAAKQGADVISMSASGFNGAIEPFVQEANDLGSVVVISATATTNRYSTFGFPAASRGAVAVFAGGPDGQLWDRNPPPPAEDTSAREIVPIGDPTLVAPGIDTPAGGIPDGGTWISGASRTGTSGATAITAGAFALLASKYPDASADQLIQTVIRNNDGEETEPIAWTPERGWGNLQISRALAVDPTTYPDVNPLRMPRSEALERFADVDGTDAGAPQDSDDAAGGASGDAEAAEPRAAQEPGPATSGLPLPALVGAAIALLLLAGVVLALRRRGAGPTPSPTENVTDAHDQGER